ncbi:putative 60S ribosomal protein L6 [Stachybotrys elegans]|uniref:60S ribosomal protein L6 n=1 Tax=Stachybotrys elegans TaxID=80388 RepID=A0A8K0SMC9_9HYPO|nr:putative 60S ribosomal protein L6 [Stachybotrys elegans]
MAAMIAPAWGKALGHAALSAPSATLPSFLVPALQKKTFTLSPRRHPFSTTSTRPSKLGRTPISLPDGVDLLVGEPITMKDPTSYKSTVKRVVTVTGPLGELKLDIPDFVEISHDLENKSISVGVKNNAVKRQKEMWGTSWAYLNNYVTGVSEGHTAIIRLVGVGYRAMLEPRRSKEEYPGQQFLCLKLGYTHPIEMGVPKGVKVTVPSPTRILLEGVDRETIMSFAGKVRLWRPPEPYKGKGVFINDQTIKLKDKKIK